MGCARAGSRWRWPNGVIPYTINEKDFPDNSNERRQIEAAMRAWASPITRIRFKPRNNEQNWVEFVSGNEYSACSSHVGKQQSPGSQKVYCDPSSGALVHEIGHAIGLWHEHTREDRGLNVEVFLENVRADKRHNYDRHVGDGIDIGPYDRQSVMHYHDRQFAVKWLPAVSIFGQTSKEAPALASFSGKLHLLHLGEGSNNIWHSWTTDGRNWTENVRIPDQSSKASPALAVWNNELHMVHIGSSSNNLWHSWSTDGRNWIENKPIPDQSSQSPPALCEFEGKLHIAHIGNSSATIWHSIYNANGWTPNDRKDNNESLRSPALAVFNSRLHSVHKGKSSTRLWHTMRDTNLITLRGLSGLVIGSTGSLTQGDITAVNSIYS